MEPMLAFHNKEEVKEKYLKRVQKHYELDEIIQGIYWQNGKGCAVGCTVEKNSNSHEAMEKELGIPQMVSRLEDRIFEGLSNGDAKKFPLRFLKAIKPGADLSKVGYKFQIWLLVDKHNGVIQWANEETKKIILEIAKLQKALSEGKEIDPVAAWSAAWSADWSAAWSAD